MNETVRLELASGTLCRSGTVLGRFVPTSSTHGALELAGRRFEYRVRPERTGYHVGIYRLGAEVAARAYDFHEGTNTARISHQLQLDVERGAFYCATRLICLVECSPSAVVVQFPGLIADDTMNLVAALAALDAMWANRLSFTPTETAT